MIDAVLTHFVKTRLACITFTSTGSFVQPHTQSCSFVIHAATLVMFVIPLSLDRFTTGDFLSVAPLTELHMADTLGGLRDDK